MSMLVGLRGQGRDGDGSSPSSSSGGSTAVARDPLIQPSTSYYNINSSSNIWISGTPGLSSYRDPSLPSFASAFSPLIPKQEVRTGHSQQRGSPGVIQPPAFYPFLTGLPDFVDTSVYYSSNDSKGTKVIPASENLAHGSMDGGSDKREFQNPTASLQSPVRNTVIDLKVRSVVGGSFDDLSEGGKGVVPQPEISLDGRGSSQSGFDSEKLVGLKNVEEPCLETRESLIKFKDAEIKDQIESESALPGIKIKAGNADDGIPSGVFVFGAGAATRDRKPSEQSMAGAQSKNRVSKQRRNLHSGKTRCTFSGLSASFSPSSSFKRGGTNSPVTSEGGCNPRAKDYTFFPGCSDAVFPIDDYLPEDIVGNFSYPSSSAALDLPFSPSKTPVGASPTFKNLMYEGDSGTFPSANHELSSEGWKENDMADGPVYDDSWEWDSLSQARRAPIGELHESFFKHPLDGHIQSDNLDTGPINHLASIKQIEDNDASHEHQPPEFSVLGNWNLHDASSAWFFPENDESFYEEILNSPYCDDDEGSLKYELDDKFPECCACSTSCAECSQNVPKGTENIQSSIVQEVTAHDFRPQELQQKFVFKAVKVTDSVSETSNVSPHSKATAFVELSPSFGTLGSDLMGSNPAVTTEHLQKKDKEIYSADVNISSAPDRSSSENFTVLRREGSVPDIFAFGEGHSEEVDRKLGDRFHVGASLSAGGSIFTDAHASSSQSGVSAPSSPSFVFQALSGSDKTLKKKKDKVVHSEGAYNRLAGHLVSKSMRQHIASSRKQESWSCDATKTGPSVDFSIKSHEEIGSPSLCPDATMPDFGGIATSWDVEFPGVITEEEGDSGFYLRQKLEDDDIQIEDIIAAAGELNLEEENDRNGEPDWKDHQGSDEEQWWTANDAFMNELVPRKGKLKRPSSDMGEVTYLGSEVHLQAVQMDAEKASGDDVSSMSTSDINNVKFFTFSATSSTPTSLSSPRRHTRKVYPERTGVVTLKNQQFLNSNVELDNVANAHKDFMAKNTTDLGTCQETKLDTMSENLDSSLTFQSMIPAVRLRSELDQVGSGPCLVNSISSTSSEDRPNSSTTPVTLSSNIRPSVDAAPTISSRAPLDIAAEEACERWRLRGNQAYANGDFPKAEEYYTRGASSVSPNETSQNCIRASMLCYSNRAATLMVVGRLREALMDCMRALAVDPSFLRVRLRAASCHLALGETEAAALIFGECLRRSKDDASSDPKIVSEALEGLRKSQQVHEYLERMVALLETRSSTDATTALRLLNEALKCSPHSDHLLELKVHALFTLRRFKEVVQLCEQTLALAERNFPITLEKSPSNIPSTSSQAANSSSNCNVRLWRQKSTAKAYYHLGKLEEALELIQKMEALLHKYHHVDSEKDMSTLCLLIRDLLRHKAAGNEAFQSGKYAEAIEHYTAALACNGESRPFNAVLFCNRAAASQALGHIPDAVADCSRAIVLDPKYAKAISRRATLHEMVRDYAQASNDLRRLITLLENQLEHAKENQINKVEVSSTLQEELQQSQERLTKNDEEFKKGHPRDCYLILGLDPSCTTGEIRKAYRKLALRHHPDKAGQFLARSDGGEDGSLWKEVGEEVRRDAEQLFKLIGEAHATLSDTSKRLNYDKEEDLRKLRIRYVSEGPSNGSDMFRHYHEKGGRRQHWGSWGEFGNHQQRWQNGPDAAQPDMFAHVGQYESGTKNTSGRWEYDWEEV